MVAPPRLPGPSPDQGPRHLTFATAGSPRPSRPWISCKELRDLIGPGFQGCMPDPATMQARQPILAPGRGLSLQALAHAGATLTGRLVAVDDRRVIFDDSAPANIAAG